jgi:hypothetical protein
MRASVCFKFLRPPGAKQRVQISSNRHANYEGNGRTLYPWNESDFNRFTEAEPTNMMGSIFGSRRVLDLPAREKWTTMEFAPVNALEPVSINFLKGPWPPLAWYSQYEPE